MKTESELQYILPQPDDFLRAVTGNILYNVRKGFDTEVYLPPLVTRANMLVNEIGIMPMMVYPSDTELNITKG
jgi:hypothetical protein